MNKLDALRFFATAAGTLNFREAAVQLASSPSVVTRTIAELEQQLGEPLFTRNTRSIVLTSFGEQFLPQAQKLLADAEKLFQPTSKNNEEIKGVVRITLASLPNHEQILYELLTTLRPYPKLWIDWRLDMGKLDSVQHRIDMGIRVGREPSPNFIIKPICPVQHIFVASPELLARLGEPKNSDDLRERYPFGGLLNPETGKAWELMLDTANKFSPRHTEFFSTDPQTQIQAALAGRVAIQASNLACRPYLENGQLVRLLPDVRLEEWKLYLYRNYQTMIPKRIVYVFGVLEGILKNHFQAP